MKHKSKLRNKSEDKDEDEDEDDSYYSMFGQMPFNDNDVDPEGANRKELERVRSKMYDIRNRLRKDRGSISKAHGGMSKWKSWNDEIFTDDINRLNRKIKNVKG